MQNIYLVLHQNIQNRFNEAGVEINSPHYASLRDGNETTIPQNYLQQNNKKPAFEFRQEDATPTRAEARVMEGAETPVARTRPSSRIRSG
jgi:hypothetical protein